jgi:hypothetical protein
MSGHLTNIPKNTSHLFFSQQSLNIEFKNRKIRQKILK